MMPKGIDESKIPRHIAIIMDGNGRWAKKRGLPRVFGHKAGAEAVRDIVRACGEWNIKVLTLYAFSVENWARPRREVSALWRLLKMYLKKEVRELMNNNVKLITIGDIDKLPVYVRNELKKIMKTTSLNTGLILNLALNYSGRAEIIHAVKKLMKDNHKNKNITEKEFSNYLFTCDLPEPDLLIRTSGEMRISNFLLWQLAYAEIWVTDVLWPDFRRKDLLSAIIDFQKRERRFGKVL